MRPEPFPQTDAELFDHISRRANERPAVPWETIASELDLTVADLLSWFVAYRQPKRERKATRKAGPPMLLSGQPGHDHWGSSSNAQRFANWRKSHDGAAKARAGD